MGASIDAFSEPAPAKINLALHILGRRPDGYHDIDSLVVFADVGDRVALAEGGPRLVIDGPFASALSTEDNLVTRAAEAMAREAGRPADLSLRLTKNLPVGSGIGGGSADAAATLRLLDRAWRLDLPAERLGAIALALGADVPMCLRSRTARATGRGETLTELPDLPALPIVLAFPGVSVSTAAVFAGLGKPSDPPLPTPPALADAKAVAAWLAQTRNGLEAAASKAAPVIGEALAMLGDTEGCLFARMSGSGSCCFGIYPTPAAARGAAAAIQQAQPHWWVRAATTGKRL